EDRRVTLTADWASDTVRRYLFKDEEFREVDRWGAIPPQYVILQRITVGLFAILGRLNATANWRRIVLEIWFGEPPATPLGELEASWRDGVCGSACSITPSQEPATSLKCAPVGSAA